MKGFEIFFKLAEIVKTKYPDIQFVATGNYKDKSHFVKFVGMLNREKLQSLYLKSRCTLVPSVWDEPFSLVTLESLATGTPVIAFDVGILKSIIHDGENGFIVPLMAIDRMADRIIKIATDDELFSRLSENAKRASKEFTEDKKMKLLNTIIRESLWPVFSFMLGCKGICDREE